MTLFHAVAEPASVVAIVLPFVPVSKSAVHWANSSAHSFRTYAHVLLDRTEINLSGMLGTQQVRHTEGHTSSVEAPVFAGQT